MRPPSSLTDHFGHLKTDRPAPERPLLLTAVLADASNLGFYKMAEACANTSVAQLSRLVAGTSGTNLQPVAGRVD